MIREQKVELLPSAPILPNPMLYVVPFWGVVIYYIVFQKTYFFLKSINPLLFPIFSFTFYFAKNIFFHFSVFSTNFSTKTCLFLNNWAYVSTLLLSRIFFKSILLYSLYLLLLYKPYNTPFFYD